MGTPQQLKVASAKIYEIECADWLKAFEVLRANDDRIGESSLFGTKIHVALKLGSDDLVDTLLSSADCGLLSKREIVPSLEDAFVSLLNPEKK